jgi:hypothetical protein
MYNATTGVVTIPSSGWYDLKAGYVGSATTTHLNDYFIVEIYNATTATVLASKSHVYDGANTQGISIATSADGVKLNALDQIYVRAFNVGSTTPVFSNAGVAYNNFSVKKITGPAQIAASESVSALYTGAPPTGTLDTTYNNIITFGTKVKDSAGAYASGSYTIPTSGVYDISASVRIAGTFALNNQTGLSIHIGGVSTYQNLIYAGGAVTAMIVPLSVRSIPLLAGTVITIRAYTQATTPTFASSATDNFFSINRSGNY